MVKVAQKKAPKPKESKFLIAALEYANRGWAVYPLRTKKDGKKAALEGGYAGAVTNEKVIRGWWSADKDYPGPNANVGLWPAKSGFFVLDIDHKPSTEKNPNPDNGHETLAALEKEHGELPNTVEVLTGGRDDDDMPGRHIYFKLPKDVILKDGPIKGCPGLEIVGIKKGILAPPSLHDKTGLEYIFEADHHPDDVEIVGATEWLLGLGKKKEQPKESPLIPIQKSKQHLPINYARVDWDEQVMEMARLTEGAPETQYEGRNKACYLKGQTLGHYVANGVMDEAIGKQELLQAALKSGLTEKEALAAINSGFDDGMANPDGWSRTHFMDQCIRHLQTGMGWLWEFYYGNEYRYDHAEKENSAWHRYSSHYWIKDDIRENTSVFGKVSSAIKNRYVKLKAEDFDLPKGHYKLKVNNALEKQCVQVKKNILGARWREDVLKTARDGRSIISISSRNKILEDGSLNPYWDRNTKLLAVKNGVLEFKPDDNLITFRDGKPQDCIRYVAQVAFKGVHGDYGSRELMPLARKGERWQSFIDEIFNGDRKLYHFVRCLLGYSLNNKQSERIFPIFWGSGANGKTTFFEALRGVLGNGLSGPIKTKAILKAKSDSPASAHDEDIMPLRGRKIAWCSEAGKGSYLNEERLKLLTGNDTIVARRIYGSSDDWTPTHTLYLLCNDRPVIEINSKAVWDRVQLIPFTVEFVDQIENATQKQREHGLTERLIKEGPYILAWMLMGWLSYNRLGKLEIPEVVGLASDEYKASTNSLLGFIKAECERWEKGCGKKYSEYRTQHKVLYDAYKTWCDEEGIHPIKVREASEYLEKQFKVAYDKNKKMYLGVCWLGGK